MASTFAIIETSSLPTIASSKAFVNWTHGLCLGYPRRTRYAFKVAAGRGRGRKAPDRQQALVIEDNMHQVLRPISRESGESAEVHQNGAVAVKDTNLLLRQTERQAQSCGGGKP